MKIRPVGAELFRADRRTDVTKLIFGFRIFADVRLTVLASPFQVLRFEVARRH